MQINGIVEEINKMRNDIAAPARECIVCNKPAVDRSDFCQMHIAVLADMMLEEEVQRVIRQRDTSPRDWLHLMNCQAL
jgi:hypothetical protein